MGAKLDHGKVTIQNSEVLSLNEQNTVGAMLDHGEVTIQNSEVLSLTEQNTARATLDHKVSMQNEVL